MHHSEQKCTHFCAEWCIVGCERGSVELSIRNSCIVGFVRLITFRDLTKSGTMIVVSVMVASVTSAIIIVIIRSHRLERKSRVPLIPTLNRVFSMTLWCIPYKEYTPMIMHAFRAFRVLLWLGSDRFYPYPLWSLHWN